LYGECGGRCSELDARRPMLPRATEVVAWRPPQ